MKLFGDTGKHQHVGETSAPAKRKKPANNHVSTKEVETQAKAASKPLQMNMKKFRKPLIIIACVILFVLLLVLGYSIWEKPPETVDDGPAVQLTPKPAVPESTPTSVTLDQPTETAQPEDEDIPLPEETEPQNETIRKSDCYTFALLAYDQLKANTDTIIVGRFDVGAGTLDLVNIPRDTLVNVSWGVKKLNTVLASERNDPERFLAHLGNLIGYTVDCYAVADIRAVEKLVDCIGGVYYNVPRDMHYDDPTQDLHIHIEKGYQLLTGENAVKVLRFRMGNEDTGYANGDLGRIATQQSFLETMISQFLTLGNIPNLNSALEIFQTYVETNLSANNLAYFAREFLLLDRENIRFHTLPGEGAYIRGGAYFEVSIDEWVGIVNDYLSPFNQVITADNLNILQYTGRDYTGAVSTTGEVIPITSFYDFSKYTG